MAMMIKDPNAIVHPPIPQPNGGGAISVTINGAGQPALEGQNTAATVTQPDPRNNKNSIVVGPIGVRGNAPSGLGVYGRSQTQAGVQGESVSSNGVKGLSHASGQAAVLGRSDASPVKLAGQFDGDVQINGKLTVSGATPGFAAMRDQGSISAETPGGAWLLAVAGAAQQTISSVSVIANPQLGADDNTFWTGNLVETTPSGQAVNTVGTFTTKTSASGGTGNWPRGQGVTLWSGSHTFAAASNQLWIQWTPHYTSSMPDVPGATTIVVP
jgi:hypothetical protein